MGSGRRSGHDVRVRGENHLQDRTRVKRVYKINALLLENYIQVSGSNVVMMGGTGVPFQAYK